MPSLATARTGVIHPPPPCFSDSRRWWKGAENPASISVTVSCDAITAKQKGVPPAPAAPDRKPAAGWRATCPYSTSQTPRGVTRSEPGRHGDGLGLGVVAERLEPLLPPDAAAVVSAERRLHPRLGPVHRDLPGDQGRGHAQGAARVSGPDRGDQPVLRVVGQFNRLSLVG